eukprot:GEMP01074108.1.p1 GENE.GEMP01074108.1~~GEMP01074108.1.p1  ORF type:complete len:236 (+),score=50.68 GEMP01074108.1:132-839(+)
MDISLVEGYGQHAYSPIGVRSSVLSDSTRSGRRMPYSVLNRHRQVMETRIGQQKRLMMWIVSALKDCLFRMREVGLTKEALESIRKTCGLLRSMHPGDRDEAVPGSSRHLLTRDLYATAGAKIKKQLALKEIHIIDAASHLWGDDSERDQQMVEFEVQWLAHAVAEHDAEVRMLELGVSAENIDAMRYFPKVDIQDVLESVALVVQQSYRQADSSIGVEQQVTIRQSRIKENEII